MNDTTPPTIEDVTKWTAVLTAHDGATEVRSILATGKGARSKIFPAGTKPRIIAVYALTEDRRPEVKGVYLTMNPLRAGLKGSASDKDVTRRHWLLVDIDPDRPPDTNATAAEKQAACKLAHTIRFALAAAGIPTAILADSGNGWHLLICVDLPNSEESLDLVKAFLATLDRTYSTDQVHVDLKVSNASRITKFYGTTPRKGEATRDRPHRPSRLVEIPDHGEVATAEMIRKYVADHEPAPTPQPEPEHTDAQRRGPLKMTATNGRPDVETRAIAYLAKCDPAISGQRGHGKTFGVACRIGPGFDLVPGVALRLIREHYNPRCQPPWSDKELEHKVADAYRVEAQRGWLRDQERSNGNGVHANGKAHTNGTTDGGFVGSVGTPGEENPKFEVDPRPIGVDLLSVPPLAPEMIPESLRPWIVDIAQRGCFPIEYPAVAAIAALASLVGRKLAIRPKQHDTWKVVPNLWAAIVGPPGIQKSPAVEEVLRAVRRLIADAIRRHEELIQQHNIDMAVAEVRAAAAKDELKKAAKKKVSEIELRELALEATAAAEQTTPVLKRYVVNDTTVEKLGELLAENPNGLLLFRDELTGFFRTMDRQGHESDRGFYLESWNGNGSYVYDRIGRGTVLIPHVCLSILGTIQPGPLARYLKGAATGDEADGFMPRFQLLVYPDPPAEFVNVDKFPDTVAKNRAYEIFKALDEFNPIERGCQIDEDQGLAYIGFDDEAQALFNEWRVDLENRLRGGMENVLLTCHLAKYRSLLPSLALLFHLIEVRDEPKIGPVTLKATETAAAWCDLLEQHARRIYQAALDGDPENAQRLAQRIKASLPNPFTYRVVAQKGWSGLDSVESVKQAVGILEDRGWVKVVEAPSSPQGGRPSEKVWVHPKLIGGAE